LVIYTPKKTIKISYSRQREVVFSYGRLKNNNFFHEEVFVAQHLNSDNKNEKKKEKIKFKLVLQT
jgi:hypothetical protein